MVTTQTALASKPLSRSVDAIGQSVARLQTYLPTQETTDVLMDFLEDDLREGLAAVDAVESHFTDILDLLANEPLSAHALVQAADDLRAMSRLEHLVGLVARVRQRLNQAAGRLEASAQS